MSVFDEMADAIAARAKAAGWETGEVTASSLGGPQAYRYIEFPTSGDVRRMLLTEQSVERLDKVEFEKFSFIGDYSAITDLEAGTIEAGLISRDVTGPSNPARRLGLERYRGYPEVEVSEAAPSILRAERADGMALEISSSSADFNSIARPYSNSLTLKIYVKRRLTASDAEAILETLSNSLFFQIDLERDVALSLQKRPRRSRAKMLKQPADPITITFPRFEYDSAPISLYWYAKSARGMPLLQFLAFYQVAEFYFPNFAKLDAIRTTRKLLKDPSFRVERESDLTRLISSITGAGRVTTNEKEQLKATVSEVLSADDVLRFMNENDEAVAVLSKKQRGVTDKVIPFAKKGHDYRPEISDLLYDVRCRIVHTKNEFDGGKSEMLLPYSGAETGMGPCVDLMQLVARQALIRSSSNMREI